MRFYGQIEKINSAAPVWVAIYQQCEFLLIFWQGRDMLWKMGNNSKTLQGQCGKHMWDTPDARLSSHDCTVSILQAVNFCLCLLNKPEKFKDCNPAPYNFLVWFCKADNFGYASTGTYSSPQPVAWGNRHIVRGEHAGEYAVTQLLSDFVFHTGVCAWLLHGSKRVSVGRDGAPGVTTH